MKPHNFSVKKRLQSFKYAFNGIGILFIEEHNSRVHLLAATCVCIAGFIFNISANEWIGVILSIGFVITLEIINSAIENICDFISPDKHDQIKKIKDISAAGVLMAALVSLSVGLIVFVPRFIDLL